MTHRALFPDRALCGTGSALQGRFQAGAPASDAHSPTSDAHSTASDAHPLISRPKVDQPDGRTTLWFVNPGGAFGVSGAYGPYVDSGGVWRAVADSAGP